MNRKTILVTGAAGFLGSHFIEEVLDNTDWDIVALCRLTKVGDLNRIIGSLKVKENSDRIKLIYHDLKFEIPSYTSESIGKIDYIVHMAANSHVDRSINYPKQFFEDNVMGTVNLLEWYRLNAPNALFINYLTDEVFGPAPLNYDFKEDDRWRPSNPYSASKAGQGAAGISYYNTYKLPIITTYTMNLFGERQDKEKLIAKSIRNILLNRPIPLYAKLDNHKNIDYIAQRTWLYARNAANATLFLIKNGVVGEHYNVVGNIEYKNNDLINLLGSLLNKKPVLEYIDSDTIRPGHDRRYGLDGSKLKSMGWTQPIDFEISLKQTIDWVIKETGISN